MSIARIRAMNGQQFIDDIAQAVEIVVWCRETRAYMEVKKTPLREVAQKQVVRYYMTKNLYKHRRWTMVIK